MSASGMPVTIDSGRLKRVLEGTDTLYAQAIAPSATNAVLAVTGNGTGELKLGIAGVITRVLGDLTVDGAEIVTGGTTFNGNVTMGDNDGDTIAIGGGTSDSATLKCDLGIDNAVDVRFARATGTGVMVLPDGSTGEVGAIRVNSSNEFQWWNGSSWTTAGTSVTDTLQATYEAGSTISTNATGTDLQFTVTTNGDFDVLNGTDSWGFNYGAANQLNVAAVLQTFDVDTAGALTLDAAAGSNFTTSSGDIDISAAAELDLDGGTSVAVDAGSTMVLTATTTMDLDAGGALSINSSAGAINIGNDAIAQNINIGTGAAARTIAIGNATGATALDLDAGTGGIDIDVTAATGAIALDTAGGAIQIGANAAAGDISIGTNATARTLNIGNQTGAAAVNIYGGTGNVNLDGGGGEITFEDVRYTGSPSSGSTVPLPFSDASNDDFDFAATSLIHAINTAYGSGGNTLDQAYDQGGAGSGATVTVDSGAIEFTGSNAADYTLEVTNSGNGGALFVNNTGTGLTLDIQDGGSNVLQIADGGAFDIDASTFDLDASGAVTIDSTSTIDIGANAAAGDMNFGTNATARTIAIGNTTGATAVNIDAGTGGISFDTAGASNFTVSGATSDLTLGARGATVTLNEDGQTTLSGFTATSIIGSLNELKGEVSGIGTWAETADEAIAQYDIIALDDAGATGKVVKANAGTAGQDVVMGVATAAAAGGASVDIQSSGKISATTSDVGAWTVGQDVFMSATDGEVTSTPPTAGNVQRVGQSLDTGTAGTRTIALLIGEPVDL